MLRRTQLGVSLAVFLVLVSVMIFQSAAGQEVSRDLHARSRLFPDVGPGLSELKRGPAGRYYILAAPAGSVAIYSGDGKRIGQIPNANSRGAAIVFAEDIDLDATGRVFVADRGANAIKIFGPDGSPGATIPVPSPTSVEELSGGEFAVTSLRSGRLVSIYDERGKLVRSFGDLSNLIERPDQLPSLHLTRLSGDPTGHIYLGLMIAADLTIRKYDRYGYATTEITFSSVELAPETQTARHDRLTFERRGDAPPAKPAIGALGVDPVNEEIWAAMGNQLFHFDKDGVRHTIYRTFTPDGARLEPRIILVEQDRLLLGEDPNGIFEFSRPDEVSRVPAAR